MVREHFGVVASDSLSFPEAAEIRGSGSWIQLLSVRTEFLFFIELNDRSYVDLASSPGFPAFFVVAHEKWDTLGDKVTCGMSLQGYIAYNNVVAAHHTIGLHRHRKLHVTISEALLLLFTCNSEEAREALGTRLT